MSFVPPSLPRDLSSGPVSAGVHLPPVSHPYERNVVLHHIGDEHPDEDHTSSVGSRTNVSVDLEGARKVTLVEWEKDDPENPRNLPRLRKWYELFVPRQSPRLLTLSVGSLHCCRLLYVCRWPLGLVLSLGTFLGLPKSFMYRRKSSILQSRSLWLGLVLVGLYGGLCVL